MSPSRTVPDTARRSLSHWSEAGRSEMESFYALADEDYSRLARARDWAADLGSHTLDNRIRLLDVACGSGRFPSALLTKGLPDHPRVAVDLLDPSGFSLAEARRVLHTPFVAEHEYQMVLQDLQVEREYDVAWAIHALYAIPPAELADAVQRMSVALRTGGFGVIAQASSRSHYLTFYEAYRATFAPRVLPFVDSENVMGALRRVGIEPSVRMLRYPTTSADRPTIEAFLQRCAFDDTVSLEQMENTGPLGAYLGRCRLADGSYRFEHEVHLMTWEGR